MKKEIETLREEIKNLKAVVENMQDQLSHITKEQTCQSKPPSLRRYSDRNSSVRSSLTLLKDGSAENRPSLHHGVPQLDGAPPHVPQVPVIHFQQDEHQRSEDAVQEHSQLQCENCRQSFKNEEKLQEHQDNYEFGCDECFICYKTKFHVDLHELEKYPESTYARDHIPYPTKLQYAAGCRVHTSNEILRMI